MSKSQQGAKFSTDFAVAPLPANEDERLRAVQALALLDTAPEERFDAVVRLAAKLFDMPISYVALVDSDRQWFKSKVGLTPSESSREVAFCSHAILNDEPLIIRDAHADSRFANNPLVTGDPFIGAYAGIPLNDPTMQYKVGTLCVADHKAREFTERDAAILKDLARLIERELDMGNQIQRQEQQLELQRELLQSQEEKGLLFAQLTREKALAESFLQSLMPVEIAAELRTYGSVEPRYFHDVTVLFTDFVGFTAHTESLAAEDLVMLLNGYFIAFDRVVECYGIEKLKTIGDSYMCVGGLSEQNPSHPVDAVLAALEMRNIVRAFAGDSDGSHFGVRVGLHTGPVVAGVVGARKFAYDIWGETVNFSSRMESFRVPGLH
ncbi:MAG: phosphoserine phosphatase RsbU/P [Bryobacterales bacterium]|nr:phosphoserine phosphatase RsbU/P [Bryobacterales bacterium]